MNLVSLGDLGDFKNGVNFSSDRMGHGVPLVNVKDITGSHRIDPSALDLVDVRATEDLIARTHDIFFVRSSVKLDGIALVGKITSNEPQSIHCGFVIRFRPTSPKVDSDYLVYLLLSPEYRQRLKGLSGGAAIVNISQQVLKTLSVPLPSLSEQRRIANILSAYDDLIENNRRRMVLLEEAARHLYHEWFVRMRFPGHEHIHITNGVPEGWKPRTLGDLCEEVRESVNPDGLESDTPYIGLEHIPRRSISLSEWDTADKVTSSKRRFRQGEILFGKIRPYFHKVGIAFVDGIASSDAIVIRPRETSLHGLVLMTASSDPFVAVTAQTMKEGSKMPRADWKQMQAYPVPLPPQGLLSNFESVVGSTVQQLKTLSFANQKLRAARDLLLPRLMSGEIAA
jgi:type I restriction enzyme S subunit